MYTLTKGYKQGRAVMFYDLSESNGTSVKEMVSKDEVVKLCEDGKISNAKIQWWEGKAIVRCSNKQLPLVKVNDDGAVIGVATQAVRSGSINTDRADKAVRASENNIDISSKAQVVGKVSNKKKRNISFSGYNTKNVLEQHTLSKSIDLSGLNTVEDLFDYIARDFRVQQIDKYKAEFGKKIKLDRELSSIGGNQLKAIEYSAATYLMNMLYDEIQEVYMKWS